MSEIVNNIIGHKNVWTEVVDKNLCIGCGVCAAGFPWDIDAVTYVYHLLSYS